MLVSLSKYVARPCIAKKGHLIPEPGSNTIEVKRTLEVTLNLHTTTLFGY